MLSGSGPNFQNCGPNDAVTSGQWGIIERWVLPTGIGHRLVGVAKLPRFRAPGRAIVSRIVTKTPIQTGRYTKRTKQETDYGSTPLVEDRAFLLS